jgi:hypothetical protein
MEMVLWFVMAYFFHIRCACHILNLVARYGMAVISKALEKIKALLLTMKVMSTGPIFREVAGKFDLWRSRRWRSGFKSDTIRTLQTLHHYSVGYQPSTT